MWRAVILCGTASFFMAFLGGVLAVSLVAPSLVTAESSQPQEVRASAFTLVGEDGTVVGRWAPSTSGDALLTLYDGAGTRRLRMTGSGVVVAYDQDGTTLAFRAGRSFEVSAAGRPPLNGVQLSPDGSIGMLPPEP